MVPPAPHSRLKVIALMSKIAVHVVTYNSSETIVTCLRALLEQDAEFSLHIVDNASTDSTVEQIRALGLPVQVSSTNVGYSAAHNRALKATDSEFVLTLNPDVLLQPGYLKSMLGTLEGDRSLGSAAGCLLRVESLGDTPHAIDSIGVFMRRNRRQGLLKENTPLTDVPLEQQPIFGPDGAAAFYRRAMLEDIAVDGEIFDEDFFMHKEDIDICWRAQLAGWTSTFQPDARAHHIRRFRPNQRQRVDPKLRMFAVRNRYLLMLKNEIPRLFWRDILRIVVYDLAVLAYIVFREPASLRGLSSAWALRKRMLHKRRLIQGRRRVDAAKLAPLFAQ